MYAVSEKNEIKIVVIKYPLDLCKIKLNSAKVMYESVHVGESKTFYASIVRRFQSNKNNCGYPTISGEKTWPLNKYNFYK